MIGPWRSLASALAWGARGPGFKSRRPDQMFQGIYTTGGGHPDSHNRLGSPRTLRQPQALHLLPVQEAKQDPRPRSAARAFEPAGG